MIIHADHPKCKERSFTFKDDMGAPLSGDMANLIQIDADGYI